MVGAAGRQLAYAGAALALAACTSIFGVDELSYAPVAHDGTTAGGGGQGGATTSQTVGPGGTGGTGGGGAGGMSPGCSDDEECVDGSPCTTGLCEGRVCQQYAVAVGQPGTGEGPCEGTCQEDGACGLSLYWRDWPGDGEPFQKQALSLAWSGPDAPPPRGIWAAALSLGGGLLVVFSDQGGGTAHVRSGGWTSAPIGQLFEGLDGVEVAAASMRRPTIDGPHVLNVTTVGGGGPRFAYNYELDPLFGDITPDPNNPYTINPDNDPDAAPHSVVDADWDLGVQTAYLGTPSWVVFWSAFAGDVYTFDGGNFSWDSYGPDVGSPIWAANGPAANTTVAAYHDAGVVYLVAP